MRYECGFSRQKALGPLVKISRRLGISDKVVKKRSTPRHLMVFASNVFKLLYVQRSGKEMLTPTPLVMVELVYEFFPATLLGRRSCK
jgi:hypothetical protein